MNNFIETNNMDEKSLKKLSKSELIDLLLKQKRKNKPKIIIVDDTKPITKQRSPIPTPRKSVKKMVKEYEENIILPPSEFSDYKPIPTPRTKRNVIKQPVPTRSTKIEQTEKALKGYTKSFEINIKNKKDPLIQLQNTKKAVDYFVNERLNEMKGLKYVETLKVVFDKMSDGEIISKRVYFNSTPQTITNYIDITNSLKLSKQQILNKVAQWISEGSGWTVQSVNGHYINIVKNKPFSGSSYIQLPKELQNRMKGLINIKNEDNECFRWCHIRHLNPQDNDSQRIKKPDKQCIEKLNYSCIEFPVNVKQHNKIERQNNIRINVFGYENKQPFPVYVSKEKFENQMNLLLITENENKHFVLIKNFNRFMYNQTKYQHKKHFCMFCLQCFSSERVLNNHKENCIQVNGKQAIKMADEASYTVCYLC